MPKKKKAKETSTPEYTFNYRYTPKPYFTAPATTASPLSSQSSLNKSISSTSRLTPQRPSPTRGPTSSGFNSDTWQTQRQNNYGYNRSVSYARAATQAAATSAATSEPTRPTTSKQSSIEVVVDEDVSSATSASQNDQATTRKQFEEMFKGRVEPNVIEMVLQEVNWNENEALDLLSQLAPDENTHLHPTFSLFAASDTATASAAVYGAVTPDHNLTPTAPTLSYSSSITSLDEYGLEYCRDMTQRNLSQVADVLRNGPDDINDLDRQRLARSRATTPRTVLKNNTMTLKNISLGSTESLESNRSQYGGGGAGGSLEPSGITYPASSLTPKKSNFEKTMSLHDIPSGFDDMDGGLQLTVARDQGSADLESARSDPGGIEAFLIPLEGHGDIVLEKGMYEQLNDEKSMGEQPTSAAGDAKGPLTRSVSISDYSHAISSLTSQLHTEVMNRSSSTNDSSVGPASTSSSGRMSGGESSHSSNSGSEAVTSPVREASFPPKTGSANPASNLPATNALSASNEENQYPYNGILGSGVAVPTAFECARPKKPKATTQNDEGISALLEAAKSEEKVMFLMRGVPGSGKSMLGRRLLEDTAGDIFAGDDFFLNSRGEYKHEMEKLAEAHSWNQKRVAKAVAAGVTPIVVDNTHTQGWEMEPYIVMCVKHGYQPFLAEPNTVWRYKSKELAKRNVHGVPADKIKVMLERFEHSINARQLVERVAKRDKSLLPMAEQLLANMSGTKLSRRKPVSKTIKRNKQHATVEKLKDKKVDELTRELTQLQRAGAVPLTAKHKHEDDNQGETEIMYPSVTSLHGLKRKPTVKVLNCEKPSHSRSVDGEKPAEVKDKVPSSGPRTAERSSTSKTVTKGNALSVAVLPGKSPPTVPTSQKILPDMPREELPIRPIPASSELLTTTSLDKSVSLDSGLTLNAVKKEIFSQSTSSNNFDQSVKTKKSDNSQADSGIDSGDKTTPVGSSTLPRPACRSESSVEGALSQSASLPRPKDKSKARRSAQKKSNSTSLLQVDPDVRDRWLSNDWSIPPYPMVAPVTDTADPPPPYEEQDTNTTAAVAVITAKPPLEGAACPVKRRDAESLTEPIDYAMAYKAMQYNHQLPEGWVLMTGRSIEAFSPAHDGIARKSSTVTHDKSTEISDDDVLRSGEGETSEHKQHQLQRIHSCFPQLSKEQLAEFLTLCQGDETWATNLLLDSNKLHLPKAKHPLNRVLSLPESKRLRSKYKVGKVSLLKKINKAIVPVASCLGRQDTPSSYSQLSQDTISLNLSPEQAHSLHSVFGQGVDMPTLDGDAVCVDVPRWIAHRVYRSMISSLSAGEGKDSPSPETEEQSTEKPYVHSAVPQRPARRRKTLPHAINGTVTSTAVDDTSPTKVSPAGTSPADASHSNPLSTDAFPAAAAVGGLSEMIRADARSGLAGVVGGDVTSGRAESEQEEDPVNGYSGAHTDTVGWLSTTAPAGYGSDDAVSRFDAQSTADEDLARRLQAEDLLDMQRYAEADSLSLIADEQLARSLAAEDVAASSPQRPNFSSKLKSQKLYDMFPGVDRPFLDEAFKAHGYNLEMTVDFLSEHQSQGPSAVPQTFFLRNGPSSQTPASLQNGSISSGSRESAPVKGSTTATAGHSEGDDDQWFDVDDYTANADYEEYRAEALIHYNQRQEFLQKAAAANQRRLYDVSVHYSREAERHFQKYKKANFEAATAIFKHKNMYRSRDEIDLHGLHADEAVVVVEEIIKLKQREGKRFFHIITGRGNKSKGGVAKVRSAVENYLRKKCITYRMENEGLVRVTL